MATEPALNPAPEDGTPPQDSPKEEFITQEKLNETIAALNQQHQESLSSLQESHRVQTRELVDSFNERNSAPQASQNPSISKEEALRKLQDEGDPTALLEYTESKISQASQAAEEKIQQLQKIGGSQISSLAIQQARSDPDMPYFQEYEKEVMQAVNNSGSTDPGIVKEAYKYVVGSHYQEILEKEKEKLLRQGSDEDNLRPGGGKGGRGAPVEEGIKPEEFYTQNARDLLEAKGITADQFHQKVGRSMPFTDFKKNEVTGEVKKVRVKRFKEGFQDAVALKEENAKIEEEFEWM